MSEQDHKASIFDIAPEVKAIADANGITIKRNAKPEDAIQQVIDDIFSRAAQAKSHVRRLTKLRRMLEGDPTAFGGEMIDEIHQHAANGDAS